MLFLEPEVDYFRMQLHHLAIPTSICIPSVPKTSRNPETRANGDQECETGDENAKVDGTVPFITQEEQNKVIQRALRVALYQRFPYESYDTLENVYILAVTHLALPLVGDTGLSYEDLATLEICEHSLPPELRHRTFPSHLNALIAQRNPPDSGSVIQDRMLDHSATQGSSEEGTGKQRFNDSYFILIPDLTDEQAMVYCKGRQYAGSMLGSGKASVGPASDAARFPRSTLWDDARHSRANALEGPSEDLLSFHVVEGDMIHYVETPQGGLSEPAPRSLRFAAFKVALSQFSFEEQQYYTKKREEVRSHGSTTTLWGSTLHSSEANEVHINKTVRTILASEVPGRWRAEEEEAMKKFFTKCNSVLRAYSTPSSQMDDASKGDGGVLAPKQPGAPVSDEHKTRNVAESLGQTERLSHLYGVRRLVYSFAACDCYHLVAEDNNPLYYAKSSRATYEPHTVNVTLISDLTVSPRLTPAFSASPQRCLGARIGTTKTVEGLVVSNQPSRAPSPDIKPCAVGEKFSVGSKRHSPSPGVSPPTSGTHGSDSHAPLQRLPSNTEGYLRLTTSLVCNNVSGNLKHRKENLLEKGLSFGRLNPCHEQATEGNVKCSYEKAVCAGDVVNLFRLLATSSIAQHQLRHNVIRPVISAAVLDSSGNAGTRGALHRHYQRIKCRALLDHTWYSIPIQPVPSTQDEVQWIPIVFGSAECISDVGYRTAVHIGFFPNAEVTDDSVRGNPLRPKGTAFATDVSKQSASPGTATRSAMMPLDTNHATLQTSSSDGSKGLCFSAQLKTAVSSSNEEVPAGVSARRGGVAMSFNTGNEEVPTGVSARRGGVAMSFNTGNEEVPAGVSARRGGVAMSFNTGNLTGVGSGNVACSSEREIALRRSAMKGGSGWEQRCSSALFSPRPYRPTSLRVWEPGADDQSNSNRFEQGTRVTCAGPPAGFSATSTPWWRLPSQGPRRGDGVNAGRGECSTGGFCNDWQQCDTCGGRFPQGSTSDPRFCEHLQSRPTSVLNTYGKFSRSHSPHPSYNAMQQRQTQHYSTMGRDGRLRPPHTDRWDSNDVNGDVSPRTATDPLRGTFWKSPTLNPSNYRNGADPLLSPLSSPSCSGVLTPNAGRRPTIGEFAATNTRSSAFNCLSSFKHHGAPTEICNRTASGLENNYHGPSFCKNRAGVPTKRSVVPTFGRMDTLYDNSASGIPIYNEYGYPQGDSRVRPRGMQVMDMMYDRQWQRTQPPARMPVGAGPTNRGSLSTPWTNTTKNGVCGMRRACLPGKPPLASTRPNGASNTLNNGIAPTAVRRLTLRERIQLQRRLQQREANISAFETNIKENYCVGNDVKRLRTDVGDLSSANKTTASNGGERTTTETNSACGARTAAALAAVTFGGDPLSKGSLHSIGKDIMRLKSLTSPFAEADGVNVSFCLRDLTNAFLRMPQSEIKEYDLSKAAWLEDGVSCFVSAKPTKFNGEFENYVRHFNFHQQPFYLRERAFLFVLRVPTQPQLRLIIAVHNMHDFLSVLRQRPLRPLESWRGPHSMDEEMGGLSEKENASQLPADECNSGRTRTFLQRVCKFVKNCISGGNGGGTQQMGWAPITWGQRLALLRIQASAAVHGQAWSECTTPLLTDPVVLYSRMSFLSNRTASFAVLRCQLDTLKAFASTWIKSKRTTADENQVRMIQNRISKVESIQLGCDAPTAGIGEPKTSSSSEVQAAGRVQQRLRSLPLRKRMGAPFAWKKADTTSNSVEKKGETQRQPQLNSTISSYSSSASLCRSKPEVGGANSSTPPGGVPASDAAGAATPVADADGTLIRIAEKLTSSTDIVSGNNPFPPMRTILKLVTLWEQNAQRQRAFNDCPAEPAPYSYGGSDTVLVSNLGARAELRDHQDDYDISVSHIQQLLQWQWEYHQNSYEALSLPVFRGALVASRGCRYGSDACSSVDPKVMGVNPLSRSLLLALVKWGWLVPIDYKALHKRAVRHTAVGDNMLSRVQFGFGVRRRTLFVGVLGFTCYRGWALSLLILYAAYRCFKLAAVGLLSTGAPWPAPLHSGTSIVYSRSEAAVEAMLEERQHFLSQLLATRVLQTQHYVHNVASRLDMLLRGYSPILSLIIGIELLFVWIFFACWSGAARVSATFGVNIDLLHQYMSELIFPLPLYDNVMWCLTYMKPNVAGVETFSLVAPLFVVLCLMTQSPLRWVLYKTWEMFLHDDALVRRPVLSF